MGKGGENFKLLLDVSKNEKPQNFINSFEEIRKFDKKDKKYSFTRAVLYEDRGLINLKFNKETIKEEKINQILLDGYIKENITSLDYRFYDNTFYREACKDQQCSFLLNITNNLDLPVFQREYLLTNLRERGINNISECKFSDVISDFNGENRETRDVGCGGNLCVLDIYDFDKHKEIFTMKLIVDGETVRLLNIEINEPIQVSTQFNLRC